MRRRLALAIAAVAAAAVILFALPLAVVLQRNYRNQELLRLQRDTVAATRALDLGPPGRDPVELPPSRDRLAVYDSAGRRIIGQGPPHADGLVSSVLRTGAPADSARGRQLLAAVPLVRRERVAGALRAQRQDTRAVARTRSAWLALAGLTALLVTCATLAALALGRRLAHPLERVAEAARRLGDGDFAVRVPRGGVPEADQIAATLDDTARRLGRLVARERAFSADASHQLRTPLAALRIELEAIELRGDPPPEVGSALAQVERLQATVDTLLAVARDVPRPAGRTDLSLLLEETQRRWRGPLAEDARPLHTVRQVDRPVARASPTVVGEVLDVLLDNAHRHGEGPIIVAVREAGEWLAIDVADEGAGFGDRAEEAFSRRRSSHDGHGIGLALAQSLAHAEGGRLAITQHRPPVVTLWLPRA